MKLKRVCAWFLIFALMLSLFPSSIFALDVTLDISPYPNVDIVLSKSKTNVDLSKFEQDIKNELVSRYIPASKINIQAVEGYAISTESAGAKDIFNKWTNYPDNTGQWTFDESNNSLGSTQNVSWTGFWNRLDGAEETGDVTIEYKSKEVLRVTGQSPIKNFTNISCHPDPQGFTFRMTYENGTYSYYAFCIYAYQQTAQLYKIVNVPNPNDAASGVVTGFTSLLPTTLGQRNNYSTCLAFSEIIYNPIAEHEIKIDVKGNRIKIDYDGKPLFDVTDNNNPLMRGSYGPFTYSTPNACLYDIRIASEKTKSFLEVLNTPNWRDNAMHFIVNVEDEINNSFTSQLDEILTKTINSNIDYIGWGTNSNKSQMETFIKQNDNKGLFVLNTNYQNAVIKTADYIQERLETLFEDSPYIIKDYPIALNIDPAELQYNAYNPDFPDGRWQIIHDADYFENSNGVYEKSGVYQKNFNVDKFSNVGKYTIHFDNKPVEQFFVHRMPTAGFIFVNNNGQIIISRRLSSDPDSTDNSRGFGPGIAAERWQYKLASATSWTNGLPSNIGNNNYILKLEVQDYQGQWSDPVTKYVSNSATPLPPISDFIFKQNTISKYETPVIEDASYDPLGLPITKYIWKVVKDKNTTIINNQQVTTFTTPSINFQSYGAGEYEYSLTAVNSAGLSSSAFSRTITVVNDNVPPSINVTGGTTEWADKHNVTLSVNDSNTILKEVKYAVTSTSTIPSSWTTVSPSNTYSWGLNLVIDTPVENYVHIKATDNAGNESIITRGPFKVDGTAPEIEIIPESGFWKAEHDVQINIEDEHTELTEVKYAVTDGNVTPTSWTNATPSNDTKTHTINFTIDELISGRAIQYYVHVKAKDIGNNEGTLVKGPYQIDGVKPVINSVKATELDLMPQDLDEPLNTNKSVQLDFNITEIHSGFDFLEYKLPNEEWIKNEIGSKSFIIDKMIVGAIQVRAHDKAGNISDIFEINNLIIENTAPVITVSYPPEWSNANIQLTIDGWDDNGVASVIWQTSESEPQMGSILPEELPATVTLSNEGIYSFNATIYDKSGNSTRSETRTIRIDKESPVVGDIVIHAPQNKIVIEEQKANANLLLAGTSINARTSFASTDTSFETWYGRKPIIEIVANDVSGDTNSGVAYITYRLVSDDGSIETPWEKITPDSKGRFFFILNNDFEGTVYVKAYDKANNVSVQYSEWMSIKTPSSTGQSSTGDGGTGTGNTTTNYAPTLYLSVPNTSWVSSAKANIIANDNSGLASVKMTVETTNSTVDSYEKELLKNMANTTLDVEEIFNISGIYDITITAKDTDGKETVVTGTIKVDNDLPVINSVNTELVGPDGTPVLPDDDIEGKRVKVTVDVTDDLSGLDYLEYKTPDSDEWIPVAKGQTSFYVSTNYNGEIEVRGYDKAGNGSPKYNSDPISVTSPATVQISRPSGWGGTDGKTINISSTRWDEIEKIVYSYIPADGIEKAVTITSDGTTSSYDEDELFTAPGTYEVVFNIYKKDGNMNIVSREIKIDTITSFKAPSINSFGYEFGSVTDEDVVLDLFYNPEDMPASGIARYEYKDPTSGQWIEGIPTLSGDTDEEYIFRAVSNSGLVSETTEPVKIKISSITNYFPTLELVSGNIGKDYLIELKASDWVEKTDSGYLYIWEDGKVGGNYTPAMKVLSSDSRVSILGDGIYVDGEGILKPGTTYWITTDVGFVQDTFYNPSKALDKICFKTEKAPSVEINSGAGNDILISTGKPSGGKTEYDIFLEPGFSGELELVIPNGDTIKNTGSEGGLIVNGNGNSLGITIPEDADLENGKVIIKTESGNELIFNVIPSEINVNLNIDPSTGVSDIDKNTVISSIDFTEYLKPGYSADVTLNVKHGSGNRYSDDIEKAENIIKNSLKYNDLSKPIVIEALVSVYDKDGNIVQEFVVDDFKSPLEIEVEINGMNDFNHSDFGAIFSPSNSTNGNFVNDIIKSYDKMTIGLTSPGEIFVTSKEEYQDIEEDYDRYNDDDDRDYDNKKDSISWEEKLGLDKIETEEKTPEFEITINLPSLTNTNKEYYKPDLNWYNHIPESMVGVSDINILRDTYCIVPISVNNIDMIAPYSYVNTNDMFEFVKPSDETYALVKNHHDFNDMTYNWAYAAVHAMASREIVVGYPDGGFHPNNNITRGEFATMLARLEKLPLGTYTSSYNDVSANDWYHPYIEAVTAAGYMNGYNNGNFGPKDPITREQMAATLYRYLQYRGWMPDTTDMGKIADKNSASAYAVDGINALYNLGIITGYPDSTFKPRNNATRAETCNMIWKLILNEVNNRYDTFELDIFDVNQNTTGPKHEFYL